MKAKTTKSIKLTAAQLRVLKDMSDDTFKFPGRNETRSCERLEALKFAAGDLMISRRDNVRGTTELLRAYRRTEAGREFLKREQLT